MEQNRAVVAGSGGGGLPCKMGDPLGQQNRGLRATPAGNHPPLHSFTAAPRLALLLVDCTSDTLRNLYSRCRNRRSGKDRPQCRRRRLRHDRRRSTRSWPRPISEGRGPMRGWRACWSRRASDGMCVQTPRRPATVFSSRNGRKRARKEEEQIADESGRFCCVR